MEKSTAPKKKKQKVDHNPRYVHLFMLEKETFRRLLMNNRNVQRRTRQFHSLKEVDKSLRHLDAEALEQYLSQPKSNKTVLAHLEKVSLTSTTSSSTCWLECTRSPTI